MSKTVNLYVYKVKDPTAAARARKQAMDALGDVDGFMGWTALRRPDGTDADVFADIIEWASPDAAAAGNDQWMADDRIAPFREQITDVITGNPYQVA